jgi:hypothetical protein
MKTAYGHLTYCTNIHPGETWADHFAQIKEHVPGIKNSISPNQPFGIGLRLANTASLELRKEENLKAFQQWLKEQDCYVFTMNGFPYGGFHNTIVKDKVHQPDWTTAERVQYTNRLAQILAALLPDGMEGGISTSPLSYRYWHDKEKKEGIFQTATLNVLQVVYHLAQIKKTTGKTIHIDIEPEPDGLLQNGEEFFEWYTNYLIPVGELYLQGERLASTASQANSLIKEHIQLCYDVCHFAIGFENPEQVLKTAAANGIRIGKIQISAALKSLLGTDAQREKVISAFKQFNEPTYLHQVIARKKDGSLEYFADLPPALEKANDPDMVEWRSHFHVPLFIEDYGLLQSTQEEITTVLDLQMMQPFSTHLEVETYTWDVLPQELKLPIAQSIIREMQWVKTALKVSEPATTVS